MLCAVWRRQPAECRLGSALLALPVGGGAARGPFRLAGFTPCGLLSEHGAGVGDTGKADAPRALVDTEPTVDGGQARQHGLRLGGRGWLLG